ADAVRLGAVTGALAGLVGGGVRAWIIAPAVGAIVDRYAAVPEWFVPAALAVYVAIAFAGGAVVGGALTFAGARVARAWRTRPRT
ncbi:MAG TPA: hypothetical protein VJQ09_02230, partial [Candidatus Limnocylindria bacterium]|nr:hypothetical protein [Candidatus Limnocylindria bacterium]